MPLQDEHRHGGEQSEEQETPDTTPINADGFPQDLRPRSPAHDQVGRLGGLLWCLFTENLRQVASGKPVFFADAPDFVLANQAPFSAPFAKIIVVDGSVLLPFDPYHPLFRHGGSLTAKWVSRYQHSPAQLPAHAHDHDPDLWNQRSQLTGSGVRSRA